MMEMAKKMLTNKEIPANYLVLTTMAWLVTYYVAGRLKLERTDW
jgi:hypothetical protein